MKSLPFTVRVNAASPALADDGESELMDGTGLLIVKLAAGDVPPPGTGFTTVTCDVPAVAMSAAEMDAVSRVALL